MFKQLNKKWIGLILALSIFFNLNSVYAFEPTPWAIDTTDDYVYFGNDEFPANLPYGINIIPDLSSVGAGIVDIDVFIEDGLIDSRVISKFYIICNGKITGSFYPELYINELGQTVWRHYYRIKPNTPEQTGGLVWYQVIAVNEVGESQQYITAWSNKTDSFSLTPLQTNDKFAIAWLENIFYKLSNMHTDINARLDRIIQILENFFIPSPESQARLEQAVNDILDKTPMNEAVEQIENFRDSLNNAQSSLKNPNSELHFGGSFELIPGNSNSRIIFMDFTRYRDEVITFRTIMQAVLWVSFFYLIVARLTPKSNI